MLTLDQKKQIVKEYKKNQSIARTATKLGFNYYQVKYVIRSYKKNKRIKPRKKRTPKYTPSQRRKAVNYWLNNGGITYNTVKALGYPSRTELSNWLKEDVPDYKKRIYKTSSIKVSDKNKEKAVKELCTSPSLVDDIAKDYNVTRTAVYNWKNKSIGKGNQHSMAKKNLTKKKTSNNSKELTKEIKDLKNQIEDLSKDVFRLKMEKDILEKAAELIKKDNGISIDCLTNKEKTIIIDALRDTYKLSKLLKSLNISKSSYFYEHRALNKEDKYLEVRNIIKEIFIENRNVFGYRRIYLELKKRNITLSEKVIIRLMKQDGLIVFVPKMKKYSSYEGEITPAVKNLLKRNFHADNPFEKLLTDITEFHIPAGKVYLSPIIDCFDGLPLTWTIGTSPNAELVNEMLDEAIRLTPKDKHPIVHSDRGCHYRWPGWIERMDKAGFIRSMSKKGCSPDNSACEGFFGRLKNEFFYNKNWTNVSIEEFIKELNDYIEWYANKRIKVSLGGLSPIEYRKSLGIIK